jgi:hypothetical protein
MPVAGETIVAKRVNSAFIDFHGRLRTADEVHSMSLANLSGEYCTVLDTAAVLADNL